MFRKIILSVASLFLFSFSAGAEIRISPLIQVAPGPGFPPEVEFMESNNNLDLVRFEGRLFFAFRTAPHHFAGKNTKLYIVSSPDEKTWSFEAEVWIGSDMREPRFLVMEDRLMFYFFEAGRNPLSFTPRQTWVMERKRLGEWTEPEKVEAFGRGCVLWRLKQRNGMVYASGYCGGESMYRPGNEPVGVIFMTTRDGRGFEPVDPSRRVAVVGGNEAAFEFDSEGVLYAAVRNEGGDGKTWGGKVCRAGPENLGKWECAVTPFKYDSPLMFRHGEDIYMIARRNLDGAYDKGVRRLPGETETIYYLVRYWFTRKRTALYILDRETLTFTPVLDFPSKGDTAFPGLVRMDDTGYLVYNYSSPPAGRDIFWLAGQLGSTQIYSTVITFE